MNRSAVQEKTLSLFCTCLAGHRSSLRALRSGLSRHILPTSGRSGIPRPCTTALQLSIDSLARQGKKIVGGEGITR
jgi:hypothetical protein